MPFMLVIDQYLQSQLLMFFVDWNDLWRYYGLVAEVRVIIATFFEESLSL